MNSVGNSGTASELIHRQAAFSSRQHMIPRRYCTTSRTCKCPFPPPSMTLHPVGPNGEMKPSIHVPTAPFGNILQNCLPIASPSAQRIPPRRMRRSPRSQPPSSTHRASAANRATPAGQRLYCIVHGCTYTKPFARKADLERHLVTQHEHDLPFQRKQYTCPWACGMSFLRADKMLQHQDRVHQSRRREYEFLVSAPPEAS